MTNRKKRGAFFAKEKEVCCEGKAVNVEKEMYSQNVPLGSKAAKKATNDAANNAAKNAT